MDFIPLRLKLVNNQRAQVARKVALVSGLVNIVLAVLKTGVGYFAQSQALIADGMHSFSDLASDIIVWFTAHKASEAPDSKHPYGHQRFETAATLVLAVLLLLVAVGIIIDAFERLFMGSTGHPDAIALYAAAFSILANEGLYWYTLLAAKQINSDMLKANAWHHRTDAISSIVVLIGVAGAILGIYWLDGIAAIAVGLMIIQIGWQLGRGALDELVDTALPEAEVKQIHQAILAIDGVQSIHMLRTRKSAHIPRVDVHVLVSPRISVSEGHMIGVSIEQQLKNQFDKAMDITVHIDSEDDETMAMSENLPLRPQVIKKLDVIWGELGCTKNRKALDLHYFLGKIDLTVIFSQDCYENKHQAQKQQQQMQQQLSKHPEFGKVVVSYHFASED